MADGDIGAAPVAPVIEGYDSFSLVGRGGMASVWKAHQKSLDRDVAIKVLDQGADSTPEDDERFFGEARSLAQISYHGIVSVFDVVRSGEALCIVMEYVDGKTVGQMFRADGIFTQEDALVIAYGVGKALRHAWNNQLLIHCDIKPDNIMVNSEGEIKVADFGLSRSLRNIMQTPGTDDENVFGTPSYMPPEQALDTADMGIQADMYALGATLYHICTGRRLFEHETPDEAMTSQVQGQDSDPMDLNPALSPGFCNFIERLLAKNVRSRYDTWDAVLKDIENLIHGREAAVQALDIDASKSTVARSEKRAQAVQALKRQRPMKVVHKAAKKSWRLPSASLRITPDSKLILKRKLIKMGISLAVLLVVIVGVGIYMAIRDAKAQRLDAAAKHDLFMTQIDEIMQKPCFDMSACDMRLREVDALEEKINQYRFSFSDVLDKISQSRKELNERRRAMRN